MRLLRHRLRSAHRLRGRTALGSLLRCELGLFLCCHKLHLAQRQRVARIKLQRRLAVGVVVQRRHDAADAVRRAVARYLPDCQLSI